MAFGGAITAQESQQQFLQLLVTQIQNQDPLSPVKQEEFIQQLAQFSTLEGVERLNTQFADMLALQQLTNGAQLVGKSVRIDDGAGTQVGKVDEVSSVDGRLMLRVAGQQVGIENVLSIVDGA
ncbi:MAG: flagellar hook capping protein [Planctomycetaceae bacterium]|nr:flagellar hook capping protein [Planctomycetaceae bacterium]